MRKATLKKAVIKKATLKKEIIKKAIIIALATMFLCLTQANESKAAVKELSCKTETINWWVLKDKSKPDEVRKKIKYIHRYISVDGDNKTVKIKLKTKKKKGLACHTYDDGIKMSIKNKILTLKMKDTLKGYLVDIEDKSNGKLLERIRISYSEAHVQNKLSKAPKYNTFAEYPYKQNYDQVINDPLYTYELEKWWSTMPQYIKDTLSYTRTKIKFTTASALNGNTGYAKYYRVGKSTIQLRNSKEKQKCINQNALLHEAAHIYHALMGNNLEHELNISKEYKADKQKYGPYGATNKSEFYAEKIKYTNMLENNYYDDENLWNLILSDPGMQYYQYTSPGYNTTHIACTGYMFPSKYGKGKDDRIDSCKTSSEYLSIFRNKIKERFIAQGIPVQYVEVFYGQEDMERYLLQTYGQSVELHPVSIQ